MSDEHMTSGARLVPSHRPPTQRRAVGPATIAYQGSSSVLTRRTLAALESLGQHGRIAAALFRAQKASSRAKKYRGSTSNGVPYSVLAYDKKAEALVRLCEVLLAEESGLVWGWGVDESQDWAPHVLYVDLPNGQVSFHSLKRFEGPDYGAEWDGRRLSETRIPAWCDRLLIEAAVAIPATAPKR